MLVLWHVMNLLSLDALVHHGGERVGILRNCSLACGSGRLVKIRLEHFLYEKKAAVYRVGDLVP